MRSRPSTSGWPAPDALIGRRPAQREPAASSAAEMGSSVGDQLVELARLQAVVRGRREVVGERLDPLLGRPAGVGEPAGGVDEAAVAQPVHDRGQLGLGEVVDPAERLRRVDAHGERVEHVGLGAADPARTTRAATWPSPRCSRSMLAACQSRATGSSGTGSVRSPAYMTRPSVGALVAAFVSELGGARERRGCRRGRRGSAAAPPRSPARARRSAASGVVVSQTLGDVAGDLAVGEVVEGRVHHLGRRPGRAARRVPRSSRPSSCGGRAPPSPRSAPSEK